MKDDFGAVIGLIYKVELKVLVGNDTKLNKK
jgi:hypothetical protein